MSLHPLPSQLLDYALGELPAAEAEGLEAHLFDCEACGARAGGVTALMAGTASLVRRGEVDLVLTPSLRARLQEEGVAVRDYRIAPGGGVACGASPEDALVVVALEGPPGGFPTPLACEMHLEATGALLGRVEDVPVAPGAEVLLLGTAARTVRAMPPTRMRIRLLSGEKPVGEYLLDHQGLLP
jgi:hypothetical protein